MTSKTSAPSQRRSRRLARRDHVDLAVDEVGGQRGQAVIAGLSPPRLSSVSATRSRSAWSPVSSISSRRFMCGWPPPRLQRARDALVVFRRPEIEHRRRMPPRAGQIGAVLGLQKRRPVSSSGSAKPWKQSPVHLRRRGWVDPSAPAIVVAWPVPRLPTRGPATSSPSFLTSCTRIAGMAVAGRRRPLCPCLGAALP